MMNLNDRSSFPAYMTSLASLPASTQPKAKTVSVKAAGESPTKANPPARSGWEGITLMFIWATCSRNRAHRKILHNQRLAMKKYIGNATATYHQPAIESP